MSGMRAAPHGKEQETMERFNICYGCMNPLEEGAEICPDCGYRIGAPHLPSYLAPGISIYKSDGTQWAWANGGYSGTSNHPRWSTDNYQGGGAVGISGSGNLPIIERTSIHGGHKAQNGMKGNGVFFNDTGGGSGNPEGNVGKLVLGGLGGKGPDTSYTQVHGSGGGGSYGDGGAAGDTGSGSGGSAGTNGGGGGGGGSPAGGCAGGDGGLPGFIIFY